MDPTAAWLGLLHSPTLRRARTVATHAPHGLRLRRHCPALPRVTYYGPHTCCRFGLVRSILPGLCLCPHTHHAMHTFITLPHTTAHAHAWDIAILLLYSFRASHTTRSTAMVCILPSSHTCCHMDLPSSISDILPAVAHLPTPSVVLAPCLLPATVHHWFYYSAATPLDLTLWCVLPDYWVTDPTRLPLYYPCLCFCLPLPLLLLYVAQHLHWLPTPHTRPVPFTHIHFAHVYPTLTPCIFVCYPLDYVLYVLP